MLVSSVFIVIQSRNDTAKENAQLRCFFWLSFIFGASALCTVHYLHSDVRPGAFISLYRHAPESTFASKRYKS